MSLIQKIQEFFESTGAHIKSAFVSLFGEHAGAELAVAAESWAKTELGQIALVVVQGLETAALSPADKQKQAFQAIGAHLAAQGKTMPSSAINFAIEMALQLVRGAVATTT
jgi:hypothetical protein